jgi:hypothetical protein
MAGSILLARMPLARMPQSGANIFYNQKPKLPSSAAYYDAQRSSHIGFACVVSRCVRLTRPEAESTKNVAGSEGCVEGCGLELF